MLFPVSNQLICFSKVCKGWMILRSFIVSLLSGTLWFLCLPVCLVLIVLVSCYVIPYTCTHTPTHTLTVMCVMIQPHKFELVVNFVLSWSLTLTFVPFWAGCSISQSAIVIQTGVCLCAHTCLNAVFPILVLFFLQVCVEFISSFIFCKCYVRMRNLHAYTVQCDIFSQAGI